jgi:thiamine monophosphate kinase
MSNAKTEFFYEKLMEGIYSALKSCNCFLLGGDTGYDNAWRYAGIALGRSIQNEAITRVIKKKCDFDIWITGTCGDSNLAILTDQEIPRFEIRTEEAESTSKYALACTDSSGGFCDAVWNLKKVNPYFDFEINLDTMPYAHDLKKISREMKLPMELALIGGAGEYELLILAPRELENKFQKNPTMQKVGTGYPTANKGCVKFFKGNLQAGAMREEPPCYRSCKKEDYLRTTIEYYNNNFTKIS